MSKLIPLVTRDGTKGEQSAFQDADELDYELYERIRASINALYPEETTIETDTISVNLNMSRQTTPAYTPSGNVVIAVESENQVDGAWYSFAVVLDGVKSVSFTGEGYELFNISNGQILEAGTYEFHCWRARGITHISLPTSSGVIKDETSPTVTITSTSLNNPTSDNPITINFTLSEEAGDGTSFELSDIVLGGTATATLQNFAGSGVDYSVEVVPTTDGTITIDVPSGSFSHAGGSTNIAATQFTIEYTSVLPDTEAVVLQNVANITVTGGNNVEKTSGGDTWDALAESTKKLPQGSDGYILHTIGGVLANYLGTLTGILSGTLSTSLSALNYAVYNPGSNTYRAYVSGSSVDSNTDTSAVGHLVRLEKSASNGTTCTITWSYSSDGGDNYTQIHQLTGQNDVEMYFGLQLRTIGATLNNILLGGGNWIPR